MPSQEMEKILSTRNQMQQCFLVPSPGQIPEIEIELPQIVTGYKEAEGTCINTSIERHKEKSVASHQNGFHNFSMKFLLRFNLLKFEIDVQSRQ